MALGESGRASILVVVAALVAVILWGASPIATKYALREFSPLPVAILRSSIAGLVALPIAYLLRIAPPRLGEHRRGVALLSLAGFIGFPILFSLGLGRTSAVHGAIILAFLPVATGAFAMISQRSWPSFHWWLGCAVAVGGEAILVFVRSGPSDVAESLAGDGLTLTSVLIGALGNVAGARLQQTGYPAMGATLWGAVFATILVAPLLLWIAPGVTWQSVTPSAWAGMLYLSLCVTIIGYALWYWALGRGGIVRIGLLQFLQPVSGLILAWLLLGDKPTLAAMSATALILFGVRIATRQTEKPQDKT